MFDIHRFLARQIAILVALAISAPSLGIAQDDDEPDLNPVQNENFDVELSTGDDFDIVEEFPLDAGDEAQDADVDDAEETTTRPEPKKAKKAAKEKKDKKGKQSKKTKKA